MTYLKLIAYSVISFLLLILFVWCLPVRAERLSIDEIEDLALSTSVNEEGEVGQALEAEYNIPLIRRDGKWNCQDRTLYASRLCYQNGYQFRFKTQTDSMGNPFHAYLEIKDGQRWVPIMKQRAWMEDVEKSLANMKRRGR